METVVKTLIIKKKGRCYFDCIINGYKAKLLINDISKDLETDRVVKVEVNDLSQRTKYGSTLKFEPVAILDDRDAAALRAAAAARKEAEKWLGYAEGDAKQGLCKSNAILTALHQCKHHEHLADRLAALQERVKSNSDAFDAQKRQWAKEKSDQADAKAKQRSMRILYPVQQTPPLNVGVRLGSRVVVFESTGKTFRINEDHPSTEGSHLLGHEGEAGCYSYYRDATAEETATLETEEASERALAEAKSERLKAIKAIKADIAERGERPEGTHQPDGERCIDTQNIHGGGDWFVITDSHIWYIRNNGMDGDCWANNNVQTGGAGAIGVRVDYNDELANTIRQLSQND